ncbi:MAG: hypothetical protein PHU78_09235, partial [Heliobacteriaceae bacterium]|nr:hypothetical protein [Heliobacteriaceae bacterium]
MFSGRTQKRVWAVLVALAVLGCSGITGLSPAQGADNTLPISYDFQVVTLGNDKKIVVDFDYALTGINNPAGITVDKGAALGAPTVKDGKLELIVQDLDPAVTDYTITIPGGTLVLANYTQGGDIRIKFNPYDITPGFGSLFQGNNPTRANIIFAQNDADEITMHIPGTYITNITVLTQLDPDRAKSTAEVTVNTREVHSVKITINGTENKVDRNRGTFETGIFKQAFQGVAEGDDIFVYAYDVNGSFLGRKVTRISGDDATSFDPAQDIGYARQTKTVKDYLDGTITLVDLIGNRPVSELENIRIQYNNVPYIRTAANAGELSYAVAELTKYQLSNVGANTWLRLTGDVSDLTINEFSFPVDGMRIASSVPGTKRLLNGNIKLGDGVNTMSLSLTDVNIAGNLDIDVGNTGHVTLNNVMATSITVTSAGPNSVELNGVTANNLTVQNNNGPVRVIAGAGTAIGTTIINNDGRFNVELRQNGGQFTAVRANNTAGAGSLILSGNGTA